MSLRSEDRPERLQDSVSPKPQSIASVTVAYNGADVLRGHLDSLKRQTCKLNEIIVVDNASTDDTRHVLATEYPDVTLLRLEENGGIGGGLSAGMAYAALEKQFKWVWLFDQDSVPAPDALERLVVASQQTGEDKSSISILAPRCFHVDTQMQYPGLRWRGSRFVAIHPSGGTAITFVDMVITSGSLIRQNAIEELGLPRTDFFMDFVDYEYCLRLRRRGFRIAIVGDSVVHHAIGSPTTFSIFGSTKSWADHAPWREYYMTRNEIFTIWKYYPEIRKRLFVLYRLTQHAIGILLFGKQKMDCLRMMWHGLLDGLSGRLGIRFLPNVLDTTPMPRARNDALNDCA